MAGRPRSRAGGPKRSTDKPLRGKAAAYRNPRGPAPGSWVNGEWVEGWKGERGQSGIRHDGTWKPQFDGQPEPFDEGEANPAYEHGASSRKTVAPRAEEIVAAMLADPQAPDHLRSRAFRAAVLAWGRAEAVAAVLFTWVAEQDVEVLTTPRMAATKAPVDLWRSAEAHAANMRSKLGIDPVSYARIAKDLGIAQKASEDGLSRLAGQGAEIVASRLEIEGGSATA